MTSLEETFANITKDSQIKTLEHRCSQYLQLLRDLKVVVCEDEDLEEAQRILKEIFAVENDDDDEAESSDT